MSDDKQAFDGQTIPSEVWAAEVPRGSTSPQVDPGSASLDDMGFAERYLSRALLGEGGMGEVRLCQDRRIGREVAMKVIRSGQGDRADVRMRFLREARVQGQLEHPAVVPVYDLGKGPSGEAYFTMKRIRGVSLEDIIERLARGERDATARYSRRRLLTAFSNVCLAVDFAHQRGVLHRDLKPANVMLGDFGEVYVLDWGLAKIAGTPEPGPRPEIRPEPRIDRAPGPAVLIDDPGGSAGQTIDGQMMGTPGYMCPEQVRGEMSTLTPRADVYALGAILFELLALEPLHQGDQLAPILVSTLHGPDARPSARRPGLGVPPELEAICVKATALAEAERYPSARALHEAVERFLDGDRDLERRRELAVAHTRAAEEAADRAVSGAAGPAAEEERRRALREVGRALALDPDNVAAVGTLVRLLSEPPAEVPRAVEEAIASSARDSESFAYHAAAVAYAAWMGLIPLVLWMGIHDWRAFALCWPMIALTGLMNFIAARRPGRAWGVVAILANATGLAVGSTMFGPLVTVPGLAAMTALGPALSPDRRMRVLGVCANCLAVALPVLLAWTGLLPRPYAFHDGGLTILPQMHGFPQGPTTLYLLICSLATVVTAFLFVDRVRSVLRAAERRMHLQSWHLRQLVPEQAAPTR